MTAIFESRSQFGGTWTAGMWMNINWFFLDNDGTSRGGAHQMIHDKRELAQKLLDQSGETLLTEMSDDELLEFVAIDLNRASTE